MTVPEVQSGKGSTTKMYRLFHKILHIMLRSALKLRKETTWRASQSRGPIHGGKVDMGKKKKWYETWWGALWTLALVDANPGRGVSVFMEVDKEMADLRLASNEGSAWEPARSKTDEAPESCPEATSATCIT